MNSLLPNGEVLQAYPDRYGIGRYIDWTHIDVRSGPPSRWRKGV